MNTAKIKVDGWEGIVHDEQQNVIMGFRTDPRLMQFMYNRFDGLVITETTKYQLQDTMEFINIGWTEAKQILEGWM